MVADAGAIRDRFRRGAWLPSIVGLFALSSGLLWAKVASDRGETQMASRRRWSTLGLRPAGGLDNQEDRTCGITVGGTTARTIARFGGIQSPPRSLIQQSARVA